MKPRILLLLVAAALLSTGPVWAKVEKQKLPGMMQPKQPVSSQKMEMPDPGIPESPEIFECKECTYCADCSEGAPCINCTGCTECTDAAGLYGNPPGMGDDPDESLDGSGYPDENPGEVAIPSPVPDPDPDKVPPF